MKILEKGIETLIEYKNNPRDNDKAVEAVANSIEDFGFKVPIVVDKNNVVVCGHTRLKAARKLGLKTVPCVVADDLSEEQIKAFRLADNRVAEIATWNEDKLEKEISSGIEKLERYGFNEYELESYGAEVDTEDFFIEEEKTPREPKKHVCPYCEYEFE